MEFPNLEPHVPGANCSPVPRDPGWTKVVSLLTVGPKTIVPRARTFTGWFVVFTSYPCWDGATFAVIGLKNQEWKKTASRKNLSPANGLMCSGAGVAAGLVISVSLGLFFFFNYYPLEVIMFAKVLPFPLNTSTPNEMHLVSKAAKLVWAKTPSTQNTIYQRALSVLLFSVCLMPSI